MDGGREDGGRVSGEREGLGGREGLRGREGWMDGWMDAAVTARRLRRLRRLCLGFRAYLPTSSASSVGQVSSYWLRQPSQLHWLRQCSLWFRA